MKTAQNMAKIIDFTTYKRVREANAMGHSNIVAPFYFWYPVWVFVPQYASPDTGISAYGASASAAEI